MTSCCKALLVATFGLMLVEGCGKCPPNSQLFRGRDPSGKNVEMCARSNDLQRNGPYTEFDESGKVMITGQYADNVQVGVWRFFDKAGHFAKATCYGKGAKKTWTENRESEVDKRICP